jgi:methionyl-tRNA synthetase
VNKDLADVFGNLVNRTIRFAHRAFDGRIPEGGEPGELEGALAFELQQRIVALRRHHEALEFRRAAAETRGVWALANGYLQQAAPWSAARSDRSRAAVTTRTALNLVRLSAVLAWSVIPTLSETVLRAFDDRRQIPSWPEESTAELLDGAAGRKVELLDVLVDKITDDKVAGLQGLFGGAAGA